MRQAGLMDRLERAGVEPQDTSPALILTDIARTLRETSAKVEAARVADARHAATRRADDPPPAATSELPQILQQSEPVEASPPRRAVSLDALRGQLLAPSVLAGALVVVAILLSAAGNSVWRIASIDRPAEAGRPKLAGLAAISPLAAPSSEPSTGPSADMPARPALSLEEQMLLERCEEMIARGDMQGARDGLAKAAADGSVNAKFALAETFDPNVLAAWGLRDRVADVGVARTLYGQALEAGDPRAGRRIAALEASE